MLSRTKWVTFAILLAVMFLGAWGSLNSATCAKTTYEWQNHAVSGKGCFPPNCSDGQFPMAVVPLVAFDGNLYSIGDKRVWTSTDGLNWSSQPKTDWDERYGMQFAFFRNKLWMFGGMKTWADFRNDVWSSADGINWQKVTNKAPWSPRRGHKVLVFNNKLWLIGGSVSSGRVDETPTRFLSDVWVSETGADWKQVTANAPWNANDNPVCLEFNDKIYVITLGTSQKVWSSADGEAWTLVADSIPIGERAGSGVLVFDGKIWVFGGVEKNDTWYTSDGKNWTAAGRAPWSSRNAVYSVVYNNKLWLFSGKTGRADSWSGDIWAMSKKTE